MERGITTLDKEKDTKKLSLGKVDKLETIEHTPSSLHPDTLFNFMDKVDYLIEIIENKSIPARYCDEDISYLGVETIKKVAIPMRCFCDIKLHDLQEHIDFYGTCGIALQKKWGMDNGVQPLHYINPQSYLRRDFSEVFNSAIDHVNEESTELQNQLTDFILHELMYYKPDSGEAENRRTGKIEQKCFTDECEWRFIADVKSIDYEPIILGEEASNADYRNMLSASLKTHPEIALQFDYTEIKYLIVEDNADYERLLVSIQKLEGLSEMEKNKLISKIIIWNESKGDF